MYPDEVPKPEVTNQVNVKVTSHSRALGPARCKAQAPKVEVTSWWSCTLGGKVPNPELQTSLNVKRQSKERPRPVRYPSRG